MASNMADAVDVTRHNFDEALQSIKGAIDECDFVAFDCEMTGLFLDNNEASYLDDMPLRYYKMHASARRFLVNQFGVAAFTRGAGGGYTAKTFNLNVFPRSFQGSETRFTCQASSLEYLAQHKFDFNKMVYDGIPYLQLSHKRRLVQGVNRPRKYFRREPSTAAARKLIEDTQATVRAWHVGSSAATVSVARGCRPAERAFAYQALEELRLGDEGSPGFFVEKVGDGAEVELLVTRATKAQLAEHERAVRQQQLDSIEAAAGFSKVITALQAAGKPVIGHNMLFDLIYVLNIFVEDYPTWPAFKAGCAAWFPGGIFDTKHITRALESRHADGDAVPFFDSTTLGDLYEAVVQGKQAEGDAARWRTLLDANNGGDRVSLPGIEHAEGFTRYAGSEGAAFAHEAGFDAFMTGAVFASLLELKRASDATGAGAAAAPVLLERPMHPAGSAEQGDPPAANSAESARGTGSAMDAMAELTNRVNVMRTTLPYCVAGGAADPAMQRPGVVVLATAVPARLPERKAAYSAFANAVSQVGRVPGLRLEEVVATGPWAAWAASTWGQDDPKEYSDKLVALMNANNGFRKCQIMTWADFDEWKRGFPDTDPYNDKRVVPTADDSKSGDGEGMLQWVLKNNCTVM